MKSNVWVDDNKSDKKYIYNERTKNTIRCVKSENLKNSQKYDYYEGKPDEDYVYKLDK